MVVTSTTSCFVLWLIDYDRPLLERLRGELNSRDIRETSRDKNKGHRKKRAYQKKRGRRREMIIRCFLSFSKHVLLMFC